MATSKPDGTLNVDGFDVGYWITDDPDSGPPWGDDDADLVRVAERQHGRWQGESDKKSCEVPLNKPERGRNQYYYNWKRAMQKAKKEKWNAEPYDAPNQAERAVKANFDYYKAYLNDEWYYVGIEVWLAEHPQYEHAVGGFETYKDYHKESVKALAEELVRMYLNDLQNGKYKPKE
jgi:hypothetical protein